jgi:Ca2+-binding RTX toxin-like protein
MATLTVGQGQQFSTISGAVAASHDGDLIQVQAGTYVNDFAEIKTKITLEGVGGMVHMEATGPIPNDKGILVVDTDATIDHFEFSGATGASGNAAGIRYQGGALTLTNDYFHDNQDGLLSNPSTTGTITIKTSEFAHNGSGDGYTHNLYVGDIAKLTIQDSYFHDAVVGHEIKSRAEVTEISNTRIFDNSGSASYSVDLPNGGQATLTNNLIEQGPNSGNPNIVAYGEEGSLHANSSLTMSGDTVLNDLGRGTLLWDASGTKATLIGNQVYGLSDSQIVSGSGASVSGTTHLASEPALDTSNPWATAATPTPTPTGGQVLQASPAAMSVAGGAGADTLSGSDVGGDTLSGADGNDSIQGAAGFDNVNGNKGNDVIDGGSGGGDWLVGGQGDDLITSHHSDDILYGNLGNDTLNGGDGSEIIRGGQGDDALAGGAGNDWLSGDRGSDTISGGSGADVFHTFSGAGLDVVTDFNAAEGDRVQVDPGTSYSLSQAGADTVIDMGNGDEMVLRNVQLSSLPQDWIFTL